jgi:hypothetical protein
MGGLKMETWNDEAEAVKLGDHIEMDHEKELPGMWAFGTLWIMHETMHNLHTHWDHTHE